MQFIPRVHGNGFIQLDLTPLVRLHIWGHPDIPRQEVSTPVHDHAFGFTSRILMGALTNRRYRWVQTSVGDHEVHVVNIRDREDTTLHGTGEYGRLEQESERSYLSGHRYTMHPGDIHESIAEELTVSVIRKTGPTLSQGGPTPRVFVRRGLQPDNTFHRYQLDPEKLWAIIANVLENGNFF